MYNCVWVETLNKEIAEKKQGCVFDAEGYITSCNKYEKEPQENLTIKLKALALGVSYRKYQRLQNEISKYNLQMTPEELHKLNLELLEEKRDIKASKEKSKQEFEKWQEDKALQKEIDKAQAKEYRVTYKRFLEMKEVAKERNLTIEEYIKHLRYETKRTPDTQKAEALKISATYYCTLKRMLKGTNKSVEQYLQEREQQKQQKEIDKAQAKENRIKQSAYTKAITLGISRQYYYALQSEINRKGLKISVEEYVKQKRENAKMIRHNNLTKHRGHRRKNEPTQREKAEKLGIKLQAYKDLVKHINHKGLKISPEELYKQRQEKKHNQLLTKSK